MPFHRGVPGTLAACLALATASAFGIVSLPAATQAASVITRAGAAPVDTWPEFHGNPQLTGVSGDTSISTANASALGVARMTPVGASLGSPAIAYDPDLSETLVYQGGKGGYFNAVDADTGTIVWSDNLGMAVTASPVVEDGAVWIAPAGGGKLFKLNASTGATECIGAVTDTVLSSPVYASPPGGSPTIYLGSLGAGIKDGPVVAYSAATCAAEWSQDDYVTPGQNTGVWSSMSYAVDAGGRGLVLYGSGNPDSTVYALDAVTGALVWDYSTYSPPAEDWDVGAGVTTSPPGVNGFADGMAYVEGKDGILYAFDLTTGAPQWQYNFGGNDPTNPTITNTDALSTPALAGSTLLFGDNTGLYSVNALTGSENWDYLDSNDINSSPLVVGGPGAQVAAFGDLAGNVDVVSVSTGALLYTYKTGNLVTSSPADVDGNIVLDSMDGFLYDFAVGGGNGAAPSTAITSSAGSAPNTGSLTLTGTASAADGVAAVTVQVQESGAAGPWYDASSGSYQPGMRVATATLASPGATTSAWSLTVATPPAGGAFQAFASAVGSNGVADTTAYAKATGAAVVSYTVPAVSSAPLVAASPGRVLPGATVTVTGSGYAADEQVVFVAQGPAGSGPFTTVTATDAGTVSASAALPAGTGFGPVVLTGTGQSSGLVGSGTVEVSNLDPQLGYGPTRGGAEATDTVIEHYQSTSMNNKLVQAWQVTAAGAFDSTPAFSQGIAYVGDETGNLYGVNQVTGAVVFTTAVGGDIESSPAVDNGDVFVGDDVGVLSAVSSVGAVIWTANVGGALTSPAVYAGVVYIGSSKGTITAVNEVTGAIKWTSASIGSAVSAPAVNPTSGAVLVSSAGGVVEKLATTTGRTAWKVTLAGSLTSPLAYSGKVYVASSAGIVTALNVSTGALVWNASPDGSITAPPILAYGHVAVGTKAGTVDYYDVATGSLLATQTQFGVKTGGAITGLSSTTGLLLISSPWGLGLIQGAHYLLMTWLHPAGGTSTVPRAAAVFLNGDVFSAGTDGVLRGFTTPGRTMA